MRWATLSGLQWDEPFQFPHLLKVQEFPCGLLPQVPVNSALIPVKSSSNLDQV